jgi:hypothetical protein
MKRLWSGLWIGLAVLLLTVRLSAAPCSTSTAACSEWVIPTGASNGVLMYRTYALDAKNPAITSALVVIHGAGRDADNCFQHVLAGAFLAGALETTIVVSPRFASNDAAGCRDAIAAKELKWQCGGPERCPTRLARGLAFGKYVNERFGAKHSSVIVPACGHNARCMFTDNAALTLLFPKKSQLP